MSAPLFRGRSEGGLGGAIPPLSQTVAIFKKRPGEQASASRITFIELYDPIPPPLTWYDSIKGMLIMKLAILSLTVSGILVKYHYVSNPAVTIYDMVFVRAFS